MSEKGYDLHMHSTCSDGTYTPTELIDAAKAAGLKGISITDHDSIKAYDESLYAYAKSKEIELVIGAEFSTVLSKIPVHILAYYFDPENPDLLELCAAHRIRREERNRQIIERLQKHNIDINYEELVASGGHTIGRPHIAKLLMDKGVVSSIKEAFNLWIGDDKKCYAPGRVFKVQETLDIIKSAGGVSFLAHPILLRKKSIIKNLLSQFKFDGMECYYAAFSEVQKYQMVKIAKEYDILMSGGSDFHGDNKHYLRIGASYTNDEDLKRLKEHVRSR